MEHYITEIKIDELRHLSNLTISLNPEHRQNLIITGKNGSGKTSLLLSLQKYLQSISDGQLIALKNYHIPKLLELEKVLEEQKADAEQFSARLEYQEKLQHVEKYKDGVDFILNQYWDVIKGSLSRHFFRQTGR